MSLWFLEGNASRIVTLEVQAERQCCAVQLSRRRTAPIAVVTRGRQRRMGQSGPGLAAEETSHTLDFFAQRL